MQVLVLGIVGCASPTVSKGFSADYVIKSGSMTMKGKIFFSGEKWRTETKQYGKKVTTICRADKNVMWIISPDQKMYMEREIDLAELSSYIVKMPGEIERKKVGTEKVSGILCDKYKVTYKLTEKASPQTIYQWVSRDNIPVKFVSADGSVSSIYKNIKRGKQPAALFELPAGYKKFEMPKMPKGAY
jgi:hypothetical protein